MSLPPPPPPGSFLPPPPAIGSHLEPGTHGALAGFWRRFAGALIDGLIVYIVVAIILAILGKGQQSSTAQLFQTVLGLGYAIALIGRPQGQTFGMQAMGIRAVAIGTGGPIGYPRATGRAAMSIVSGFALLIGYLWSIWDKDKQTWHDKIASSIVVRT